MSDGYYSSNPPVDLLRNDLRPNIKSGLVKELDIVIYKLMNN